MASLNQIQEFLGRKRFAVIGVSRDSKDFTRSLFRELRQRGYDAVPVNPAISEVEGVPCYPTLAGLPQPVEAALLMTKPAVTEEVVKQCVAAGVRDVWMHRATGQGAVSDAAVRYCAENGIRVIKGECPFMFLEHTALVHRIHGFCKKIVGRYPA
jgi:predicted CoA-binding protein